jgi:flagellar L-ring protein FlgH
MRRALALLILAFAPAGMVLAQSSSLFRQAQAEKASQQAATTRPSDNGSMPENTGAAAPSAASGNTELASASLTSIKLPEPKVLKANDFVGVIIRYQLRHESRSKTEQNDKWDLNAKLSAWFRIHDRKLVEQDFERGTPEVKFNSKNDLTNEGKADRKDIFETRLMAKVLDVKPNGTLVIVAWSRMEIDDEAQYLRMSGECNRTDITADGNITSDKIFALDVRTMNEGAVRDAVKRGWFKELCDTAKPF